MRKIIRNIAALTLLFATTSGIAKDPKVSLANGNNTKSLVVEMEAQAQFSKIKLMDENAKTIYFENIQSADYAKKFNLKDLQEGIYYFTIENPLSSVEYTLYVENKNITIANIKETKTKPVFRKEGDKVYVDFLNHDLQKVDIEILDNATNQVIFKDSFKEELTIGKAFNFKKVVDGNYTIKVKDGEEVYYQNIAI